MTGYLRFFFHLLVGRQGTAQTQPCHLYGFDQASSSAAPLYIFPHMMPDGDIQVGMEGVGGPDLSNSVLRTTSMERVHCGL